MSQGEPQRLLAGRYQLIEIAGEGGMAVVWRAAARGAAGFSRPVAVKRMLPALAARPESVAMFVEEARVGSQLDHPNIVQIQDFGLDEERTYYLVMEWVEGLDLRRYILSFEQEGRPAPWAIVAAACAEVCQALDAAHGRLDDEGRPAPVFHRDISPGNVMLSVTGAVKLMDFGLARAMDRAMTTQPGIIKGKLSYLAPEMTFAKQPTRQTDLFSLGIVLWEGLAGRKLYVGEGDVDVLMAARHAVIPPLGELRPDVPQRVRAAVERALAREPTDRFATAGELGAELAAVLRRLDDPPDAPARRRSVVEARSRLRRASRPPPPPPRPPPR